MRWTGPAPHFSFDFFVDRSVVLEFTLDYELHYFTRPVGELKCFVDGDSVPLRFEVKPSSTLVRGELPVRRHLGASVITFVCPDMKSPSENNLPDRRILGIRFRCLTIEEKPQRALDEPSLRVVKTEEDERPVADSEGVEPPAKFRPRSEKSPN